MCLGAMTMSGGTTSVLICYFIAAQPPHGHDDPLMLVFALHDFASYTFWGVLLPSSFDVQLNTKIGQLSAMSPMLERSYLSCFTLIFLLDALSNQQA